MNYTGIFGSAFDPPTLGHKDVIMQASSICKQILLVPVIAHPFGKKTLNYLQRLKLLSKFMQDLCEIECIIRISTIEAVIYHTSLKKHVYTYDVLNFLETLNFESLMLIRGIDNAQPKIWQQFYRWQDIEKKWTIFTAKERLMVRSSQARKILKTQPLVTQSLTHIISPTVLNFLSQHNLYSIL